MMELMHRYTFSCAQQQALLLRREPGITKAHQAFFSLRLSRKHTSHGIPLPIRSLQRLPQIQKAAALGHCGHATCHRCRHRAAASLVFRQRPGIQLRVTPGKIQRAGSLRQRPVVQGSERQQLRPTAAQHVQTFGIGKTKGFVLRHSDRHTQRARLRFPIRQRTRRAAA